MEFRLQKPVRILPMVCVRVYVAAVYLRLMPFIRLALPHIA